MVKTSRKAVFQREDSGYRFNRHPRSDEISVQLPQLQAPRERQGRTREALAASVDAHTQTQIWIPPFTPNPSGQYPDTCNLHTMRYPYTRTTDPPRFG